MPTFISDDSIPPRSRLSPHHQRRTPPRTDLVAPPAPGRSGVADGHSRCGGGHPTAPAARTTSRVGRVGASLRAPCRDPVRFPQTGSGAWVRRSRCEPIGEPRDLVTVARDWCRGLVAHAARSHLDLRVRLGRSTPLPRWSSRCELASIVSRPVRVPRTVASGLLAQASPSHLDLRAGIWSLRCEPGGEPRDPVRVPRTGGGVAYGGRGASREASHETPGGVRAIGVG